MYVNQYQSISIPSILVWYYSIIFGCVYVCVLKVFECMYICVCETPW